MTREKRLPTILGLLLLIVGLAGGVFLVNQRQIFKLRASFGTNPNDVRITNVTATGFTVSWSTANAVSGAVLFGTASSSLTETAANDEGKTHHVDLNNLRPGTAYFFKILSGSDEVDQNGKPWSQKTAGERPLKSADLVSGTVATENGEPVEKALIYVGFPDGVTLSSTTDSLGKFSVNLSTARTASLTSYQSYDNQTILSFYVKPADGKVATAQAAVGNAKPLPTLVLGQTKDYRTLQSSGELISPKSNVKTPTGGGATSPPRTSSPPSAVARLLTVDNPKENGEMGNLKPQFSGQAPPNAKIDIILESSIVRATTTADSSGRWTWSPEEALDEGKHKLSATSTDQDGKTQTLSRNFIVLASGGSPAVGGQTSPSPSPSPTPKPSISPSPSPKTSIPPTPSGVPVSGDLTMSLLLFILGTGSVFTGILFFRKTV